MCLLSVLLGLVKFFEKPCIPTIARIAFHIKGLREYNLAIPRRLNLESVDRGNFLERYRVTDFKGAK